MSYSSVALFSDMPEGIQTTNSQPKICSLLIFLPTQMLIKGFLETGPSKLGTNVLQFLLKKMKISVPTCIYKILMNNEH